MREHDDDEDNEFFFFNGLKLRCMSVSGNWYNVKQYVLDCLYSTH